MRRPDFMSEVGLSDAVELAPFAGARSGAAPPSRPSSVAPPAPAVPIAVPSHEPSAPVPVVFPHADAAARITLLERTLAETTSRVDLAVERLRAVGERLAAEARADALEIALIAARRLLEGELTMNPEAQLGFIRAALRRLGEARSITVRLAPASAAALSGGGGVAALQAPTTAKLEIVGDPSLGPGDCVVDGDLASIDGRLDARFEELRRSVLASLQEDAA